MLTINCRDVLPIRNELVVYVSDQVAAIPTLQKDKFSLTMLDDDEDVDTGTVVASIREFLDSIGEGGNFAVVFSGHEITIASVTGKSIEREHSAQQEMFSCTHCGFVTRYQMELNVHMRIHYF